MIRLAFDVPIVHITDFTDLMDFHVAHYDLAMPDPKYRVKIQPVGLLIAPSIPLDELRRAVTLTRAQHVTVYPSEDNAKDAAEHMKQCNIALDTELAIVVPLHANELFRAAQDEEASVIYLPRDPGRLVWLLDQPRRSDQWIHFEEIEGPAELKDIVDLKILNASLHTGWPIREACGEVSPGTVMTRDQIVKARELMIAMREVCA